MADASQFLCTLRPTRIAMLTDAPTDAEADAVRRHAAYYAALAEEGILLLAGRTLEDDERTVGIAIFNAENESHVARIIAGDPAIVERVMTATIQPFRVAIQARQSPPP